MANGCTNDLSLFYDCGACKNTCATSTPMCAPAATAPTGFACTATCPDSAPTQCAGGSCVDTQTNLRNCGACSVVCPTNITHGSVGCVAGKCAITCSTAYDVCRNDCVDFQTDNQNCGGCGTGFACDKLHVCRSGKCECRTQCKDACVDLQTDSANCGTCGHGCLGAACVGGLCQPITLASGQGTPWSIALDATNVYWANYASGTVNKQPIGGGPTTALASGLAEPFDLAIDKENAYVVDRSRVSLLKIPLAGGGAPITLASGGRDMMDVAIYGGYVYWTEPDADYRGGGIFKVPVEGGGPDGGASTLVSAQYQPSRITVTSAGIFFLKYAHGEDVVMRIPLSGGDPVVLAAEARDVSDAASIVADATDVYWTTVQEGRVLKVAQTGGPIVPLASGQGYAPVLAIDDTDVYFAGGNASIKRVPKSGGPVTTLVNGQGGAPNDMAVDAQAVYWVDRAKMTVMKVAK
jgi:hypothetical protein